MDWNEDYEEEQQRAKHSSGMGCFFWMIILGLLVILVLAWYPAKLIYYSIYPEETQLKVSHSPHNKNKIEIVRIESFPDPTLRINYQDKYITKTKIPDRISVKWKNDDEAHVILTKQGREPSIVKIEFK